MKINKNILWIVAYMMIGVIGGILIGMQIQQMIFISGMVEVAEALEGTSFNIEIDLNETILVDRSMDRMEAFMREMNQSLVNSKNISDGGYGQ